MKFRYETPISYICLMKILILYRKGVTASFQNQCPFREDFINGLSLTVNEEMRKWKHP